MALNGQNRIAPVNGLRIADGGVGAGAASFTAQHSRDPQTVSRCAVPAYPHAGKRFT